MNINRSKMNDIYIKEKLFKLFFQRSSISLFIRKCVDTKYNILRITKKNYIEIVLRYSRSTVILLSCNKNMWVEHGTIVIYPKLICFKLFAQSLKYFNNFLLLTLETLLYSWSFCLTILFRCCIIYIFHISKPLMYICSIQVQTKYYLVHVRIKIKMNSLSIFLFFFISDFIIAWNVRFIVFEINRKIYEQQTCREKNIVYTIPTFRSLALTNCTLTYSLVNILTHRQVAPIMKTR